jgi:hypothetical protein
MLGKRLLELSKAREVTTSLTNFSEAQSKNYGYVICQKIWNQFELPKLLKKISTKHKVQFSLSDVSFLMAVQHLLEPRSKLGAYNHQNRYASLSNVALNHLPVPWTYSVNIKNCWKKRCSGKTATFSTCR